MGPVSGPDGYDDPLWIRIPALERDLAEAEAEAATRPDAEFALPTLLGMLGAALAERYEADGDRADLDRAVDLLLRATRLFVDHPDLPLCYWWLTHAYGARARDGGGVANYDRAIAWAEHLLDHVVADDPDRDDVAVHLLDLVWDRSWELRYSSAPDASAEAMYVEAGYLVERLDTVRLSGHHPVAQWYVRLMRGSARLERYSNAPGEADRADLDTGIAEAAPALADLTEDSAGSDVGDWVGERRLAMVGALLGAGYLMRAGLDDDAGDLDRAVTVVRDSIARSGPGQPSTFTLLTLADALKERWQRGEDLTDLDAALDAMAALLADEQDRWVAYDRAELLVECAARTGEAADARAAAAVFAYVATVTPVDPYIPWYRASEANQLLWKLTGEREALAAATDQLDRTLAEDIAPGDDLLLTYLDRLEVERQRIEVGLVSPPIVANYGRSVFRDLLTAAQHAFERSGYADPDLRAKCAGLLALAEMSVAGHDYGDVDMIRIRALLTLGATAREAPQQWKTALDAGTAMIEAIAGVQSLGPEGGVAVDRLARMVSSGTVPDDLRETVHSMLATSMAFRASDTGDRRTGRMGHRVLLRGDPGANVTRPRESAAYAQWQAGPVGDPLFEVFLHLTEHLQNVDIAGIADLIAAAKPVLDAVPATALESGMVRFMRLSAVLADPLATPLVVLPPLTTPARGLGGVTELMLSSMSAGVLLIQAVCRDDIAALEAAAAHADALLPMVLGWHRRLRLGCAGIAGSAHLHLARRGGRGPDAVAAAQRFERAMEYARDHHHPLWAQLTTGRAEALRLAGDPDRRHSRELGRSAMRAHAWQVFVQSGTEYALAAAGNAAADARMVAGWCIQDRDADAAADDDLVAILDAGRALVLRAATSGRSVADQLDAHGFGDLADEWRATHGLGRNRLTGAVLSGLAAIEGAPTVPDELRLNALRALGGEGEVIGLRPVTVAEVQAALVATGTDALVHLIPGTEKGPGRAVIVPATGRLIVRTLPAMSTGPDSPVRGFVRGSVVNRDAHVLDTSAPGTDLDELCEWAWTAAMGDVLRFTARRYGRTARLALLAWGTLGVVPWHAAFTRTGSARHYAIEEAVISYSVSARMFCDRAAQAPTPIRSALVVGDPDGDLRFAGVEARAIHRQFYPDGSYLGSTGTPGDVLDWIDSAPLRPSMLHFACHAAIDPARPSEAHLVLAGRQQLSAGELLERSRSAALDLEQVFLAACTTSVTGSHHDEVLNLATSFLAAGARTVFGSLWPVPDTETSLLMFMVHRFLRVDGCRPADALHRAQLWMLSPHREPPPEMPVELSRHCRRGTSFDPLAWAGFAHYGR